MQATNELLKVGFNRRVIRSMLSMVTATAVLVIVVAVISARSQNDLAIHSSVQLAGTAIQVKQREIARNLKDYADREDAYTNLHLRFDAAWAAADGNIGQNIYASLGYELAFVVSPAGQTVYAMIDGHPRSADAFEIIPSGLRALVESGARKTLPTVGLLKSGPDVLLVAAAAIRPPLSQVGRKETSPPSVLVFAKRLNAPLLSRIGSDYLLNRLRVVAEGEPDLGASFPLSSPDGRTIGQITWIPETPGYESLRLLLPPVAGAFIVFGLFALMTLKYARRSSAELSASAQTIETYADTLQKSEARFRDVAEASSDWIWECDRDMRLSYVSSRFADVTGHCDAIAIGKTLEHFFTIDADDAGWQERAEALTARAAFRDLRCTYRDVRSSQRIGRLAARPILDGAGTFAGYRGTATDITQEAEAQAKAVHLALHDPLTGLPNRALFRERLDVAFGEHLSERSRLAVLCIDLDHFKEVNDTLGHPVGDALLYQVGERLRDCVLPSDTVARLGGDEFAVIQNGVNQPLDAMALSSRIIERLSAPYAVDGNELQQIGASVGIAFVESDSHTSSILLKNADIALYRAKQAGRGMARTYEAHMDLELQARRALEHDLRQAIPRGQLELHYQPLIMLDDERIAGVEALVRWRHPERGLVPPVNFIPLAEENGLIVALGEWVLRTACRQAVQWPDLIIAVNLSPAQFKQRGLVQTIRQILKETGLPAHRLELEITEGVLLHDATGALAILNELKESGVRIAMDDFGTGYSSLGYLNSFPFDKIKIDKSFISDLSVEKSNAIVRSVIGLGHSLHMVITAEGVETAEQASFLRQEGCEQVQGFHFSRPLPANEMTCFIASWAKQAAQAA